MGRHLYTKHKQSTRLLATRAPSPPPPHTHKRTRIPAPSRARAPPQVGQMAASLVFVGLYIWSTYTPAPRGSWRHGADLALSALFAGDLVLRLRVRGG